MSEKHKKHESKNKTARELLALGGVILAAGGILGYERATEPGTHSVTEIVKPYDNPTTVVNRAEEEYGKDPGEFVVADEAQRVSDEYGILHAGDKIKVEVK